MIVEGFLETNKGYVDITKLTTEYRLVNLLTPTLIKEIKKSKTNVIAKFKHNPNLKVTLDSKIRTVHGVVSVSDLVGKTFYLQQLSGRVLPDEIVVVHLKKPVACYDIQSEKTDTFYCEGYPFITGDSEC